MKLQPLSDRETEKKLIWAMATNADCASIAFTIVCESDFTDSTHRRNFLTIKKSIKESRAVDLDEIKNYMDYMDCSVETGLFIPKYCKTIREFSKKRAFMTFLESAKEKIYTEDVDSFITMAGKTLAKIRKSTEVKSSDVKDISKKVLKRWDETRGKEIIGVDTGIQKLNKAIFGYRKKHYWVIGAYTNYGKTTFACYLMSCFVKTNPEETIALFSLEMGQEDIYEKVISQYAEAGYHDMRNYTDQYTSLIKDFNSTKIKIYDDKRTVEDIRFELIALELQNQLPKVIFVDFLQNMSGTGSNEYERISNVTMELQSLAMEMDICIVALSQISNEGAKGGSEVIPFKGSGTIAATADLGIQLLRNKEKEMEEGISSTELEVRIVKNRHGSLGRFHLDMNLSNAVLSSSIVDDNYKPKRSTGNALPPKTSSKGKERTQTPFNI